MKKLVFMFVAVAAISFASCGNKAAAPAPVEEEVAVEEVVDSAVVDSTVADSTVAEEAVEAVEEVAE